MSKWSEMDVEGIEAWLFMYNIVDSAKIKYYGWMKYENMQP